MREILISEYVARIESAAQYIKVHPDDAYVLEATLREYGASPKSHRFGAGVLVFGHFDGGSSYECQPWAIDPMHVNNNALSSRHDPQILELIQHGIARPSTRITRGGSPFWTTSIWPEERGGYGVHVSTRIDEYGRLQLKDVPEIELRAVARLTEPAQPLHDHTFYIPCGREDFVRIAQGEATIEQRRVA